MAFPTGVKLTNNPVAAHLLCNLEVSRHAPSSFLFFCLTPSASRGLICHLTHDPACESPSALEVDGPRQTPGCTVFTALTTKS